MIKSIIAWVFLLGMGAAIIMFARIWINNELFIEGKKLNFVDYFMGIAYGLLFVVLWFVFIPVTLFGKKDAQDMEDNQ